MTHGNIFSPSSQLIDAELWLTRHRTRLAGVGHGIPQGHFKHSDASGGLCSCEDSRASAGE